MRRLLPLPASPSTITTPPRPRSVRPHRDYSGASSERPTQCFSHVRESISVAVVRGAGVGEVEVEIEVSTGLEMLSEPGPSWLGQEPVDVLPLSQVLPGLQWVACTSRR